MLMPFNPARSRRSRRTVSSPRSWTSQGYVHIASLRSRAISGELHDGFDLDRDVVGQAAHADGGAGMLALGLEHFDQQVGAAVDHLRVLLEVRHAVHHAEQL